MMKTFAFLVAIPISFKIAISLCLFRLSLVVAFSTGLYFQDLLSRNEVEGSASAAGTNVVRHRAVEQRGHLRGGAIKNTC